MDFIVFVNHASIVKAKKEIANYGGWKNFIL
jgi:hypothetical protein